MLVNLLFLSFRGPLVNVVELIRKNCLSVSVSLDELSVNRPDSLLFV